jgi:hypothetical protein
LRILGGYNTQQINPLENPFSRRVWKNWARNGFKLPRNRTSQPKQEKTEEEDNDTTPVGVYVVVLIVLLFCVCLAGAGFWYLITNY